FFSFLIFLLGSVEDEDDFQSRLGANCAKLLAFYGNAPFARLPACLTVSINSNYEEANYRPKGKERERTRESLCVTESAAAAQPSEPTTKATLKRLK
ncbi:hypothetical protein TYRP_005865, partial [Tyrophagus putrescentiae]